ncbi:hypothetical protein [Shigella sp. FC2175]|uniref:hypothetical protein n=1 Tax=Shigella sp. FC2175 TaxID=1898680 RepID=UPI00084DAC0D|nr:hypothetical protein [Shigella sp. FC2175]EGE0956174.1 hypothetical protein [Escherichia coli]ELO4898683.1 hypothetical protein [Escherichia coli]OEG36199.1 hypothetical protein BHQ35_15645 [Shigella sp. FC2175]HAM5265401.1 hypothetical protein [Escherichia coli]HDC9175627.1 hypothetical protein [Escherichia coli]
MAKTGPISQLVDWTTDEIVENVLKGNFRKTSVYAFIRKHKGEYPHIEAAIERLNFIKLERQLERYKHLL